MNLDEIAIRVAEGMPNGFIFSEPCDHETGILISEVTEFARRLLAEVQKLQEPVAISSYEAYKEHKREKMKEAGFLKSPLRYSYTPAVLITEDTSDGYHTFKELYECRHALFVALLRSNHSVSWRANNNDDGTQYEGWFVAGMHLPSGDISFHLPVSYWELLDGCLIATTNCAPPFDGHNTADVIKRLLTPFNPAPAASKGTP